MVLAALRVSVWCQLSTVHTTDARDVPVSYEWGGAEVPMGEREKENRKSGFALCILIYWSRLIDGRALYRGLAFPVGRTTSWRKNRKERKKFHPFVGLGPGYRIQGTADAKIAR